MTLTEVFRDWLLTLGWAVVGALSMALALAILLKVFSKLTPMDEWEEIKKGNLAVAIIVAAVVVAFALVVAAAIKLI